MVQQYQSLRDPAPDAAWQKEGKPRGRIIYIAAAAGSSVLAALLLVYFVLYSGANTNQRIFDDQESTGPHVPFTMIHWGSHWSGWHNIDHMIVMGDSWSSTGFDLEGAQPSVDNPLGNPAFPGSTVTDGENWVDYLIYTFNHSTIIAADLAVGGATIDSDLIAPVVPSFALRSFKVQVQDFKDRYANSPAFPWTANTSLFTIWFGVNDIVISTNLTRNKLGLEYVEFASYVDDLYTLGARNFLLFNAPPLDRLPLAQYSESGEWSSMVQEWNGNLTHLATTFVSAHEDVTVFTVDAHSLFSAVMKDPCIYPETCGVADTTGYCTKYVYGALTPDHKDPDCAYSIDKYLWVNRLHPTTQAHNMTAHVVFDALTAGDDSFG